jgi:hypothetical protein
MHSEQLHNVYISADIVRVSKSRRMRWADHEARMGRREMHMKFWSQSLKGRDHSQDLGVDGRISDWILGKWGGKMRTGLIWLRIGINSGLT